MGSMFASWSGLRLQEVTLRAMLRCACDVDVALIERSWWVGDVEKGMLRI